jgi:hypothetical protein
MNPDHTPFNRLPLVIATADGDIRLLRGDLDLGTLDKDSIANIRSTPGVAHVVFTNRIGQHVTRASGALVGADEDLTRVGSLPNRLIDLIGRCDTLPELADQARAKAAELLAHADNFDAMAADGWMLDTDRHGHWDLHDTKPGRSYAPRPQRP